MLRYATGGYNGVNEKYGNKCSYEIDGSNFKIKSGEIIIDGVQAKIDANGQSINIVNISGTQYYSVYCEVNLSIANSKKVEIKSDYETATYPTITKGDDLTETPTGIARLELYRFTASSGVISNVSKMFNLLSMKFVKSEEFDNSNLTQIGSYIIPKKKLLWSSSSTTYISEFNLTVNGINIIGKKILITIIPNQDIYQDYKWDFVLNVNTDLIVDISGGYSYGQTFYNSGMIYSLCLFRNHVLDGGSYYLKLRAVRISDGASWTVDFIIRSIYELIE
jgi:hypothetical protein